MILVDFGLPVAKTLTFPVTCRFPLFVARSEATGEGGGVRGLQPTPNCLQRHQWDSHKTDEKLLGVEYPHPPQNTQSSARSKLLIAVKMHPKFTDLNVMFQKFSGEKPPDLHTWEWFLLHDAISRHRVHVRLSVRLSHASILSKRLNAESRKRTRL